MEQASGDCEGTELRIDWVGGLPMGGRVVPPTREELAASLHFIYREGLALAVESVIEEDNFNHILLGPNSSKYLLKEREMYVRFGTAEQASYLLGICGKDGILMSPVMVEEWGARSLAARFSVPTRPARARAAYRDIGTVIARLMQVDTQLKALGAVPGRGGVPELSDMLVQKEEFDMCVKSFQETGDKHLLHSWLCTRTRVDRGKRQATLEPLVGERIDLLLKLSRHDPDEFPFVFEREFK